VTLLDRAGVERVRFASSLDRHGTRLAVATRTATLSYDELEARVAAAAEELGSTRRLVLVIAANELDPLVAYLAALRGGHPVMLVSGDRPANVERLVERFDPDVVIGGNDGTVERRTGTAHDLHPDLALLLCTSGSTGASKLVRLSAANLQANAEAIADYLLLTPSDRAMAALPMHYCYGLSVLNSHLERGAGLVLSDLSVVDRCFWDLFRTHGATGLSGVPYTFELFDRVGFDSMDLPTLRYVTQAGGRLDPELVRRYARLGARDGWDLFVMYGQTEATARMAYLPPDLAATHPSAIGVPIPGGAFSIDPVAEGENGGELVYRGPNVMLGYADGPDDLARGATVDELRTGDLARRTDAGLYEIVGRRSRFAKILGLRLDLERLEDVLREHRIQALCASDDDRLLIGVTDGADADRAREAIQVECGLPPSRVEVIVLGSIPRLPSGKPDAGALRCVARRSAHQAERAPISGALPHGDLDIDPVVRSVLTHVLRPAAISPAATFVSLGGDSLSYVEASIALEEHLGALPRDWHTTPVGSLRRATPPPGRRAHRTETTVVLRAIAIVLVVGTHVKLFTVLGGAHLLLAIGGYNFTRFQQRTADTVRSIGRIAVPSMVWLAIATTLNERIHLTHVLLLNGWIGGDDSHGGYWYVEAIVQILVPLVAVLAIPAVRRAERRHRFAFPLVLLAVGLLVRFHVIDLPTVEPHDIRPHDIFWIFALGWAAAQARTTRHRLLVSAAALGAVPGYFGEPAREVLVVAGLLLIIWVPTIALPRLAVRIVGVVAAASLYTYLTHWQVFRPLDDHFGPLVALLGSLAAGTVAWWASRRLSRLVGRVAQVATSARGAGSRSSPASAPEPSMA